ncbi:MAG: 50S ribosomal protein L5 [Patescibacteria group bacterium]
MEKQSLKKTYNNEIIPKMREAFNYKNNLAVPKLKKIVINVGLGRLSQQAGFEEKILPEVSNDLAAITGQKPVPTLAKKSISGFKTRAGQIIGLKITLRRQKMYDFLERLTNIVFPRVRDFKGIDLKNIDAKGNLNIGLKEHVVFPEINQETLKVDFGMEISIVSNAKKKDEATKLYRLLKIPLKI